jgi:hypothetical protein
MLEVVMRTPLLLTLRSALAAAFLIASGCAGETSPGGSTTGAQVFPDEAYDTLTGAAGKLVVEVRTAPEQPPARGVATIELRIADAAGEPLDGLTVTAVPWMPDMGHGASVKPKVAAAGEGRYEVDNVNMFMPGRWELRIQATGPVEDSAKVTFQIP